MDSLDRRHMMDNIMDMVKKRQAQRGQQQGGPVAPGAYGNPTMSSSSLPTAAESGAFNERKKNQVLYGKYNYGTGQYEGGIEWEKRQDNRFDLEARAKNRNKETLGKYGGIDEWGRPIKGTEQITAEADKTRAVRTGLQRPIFEDFETPSSDNQFKPLKTKGRYNSRTGQFDPVGIQGGPGTMPNQAAMPEKQVVRMPMSKKRKWNDFVTP